MRLKIAERWRPYSHALGTRCLIPGTGICAKIYPGLVQLLDVSLAKEVVIASIPFEIEAPVRQFTICQDLERGHVDVWGDSQKGFFRYRLKAAQPGGVELVVKKSAAGSLMPEKTIFGSEQGSAYLPTSFENLSLGCSKAQEWPLIHRRLQLDEILPLWFRLGQWVPPLVANMSLSCSGGTVSLLPQLEKCIAESNLKALPFELERLYCAGFEGMLSPRGEDTEHQGFALPSLHSDPISPLILLTEGQRLIKKMFVDIQGREILILPALIPQLHCGRMLNVSLGDLGCLALEWSKKSIRRMYFTPKSDTSIAFRLHQGIHTCRLREGKSTPPRYQSGEVFDFFAAKEYVFDNFQ